MITHVLDTSAVLAHYFDEAGSTEVNDLLLAGADRIGLCVVSLVELKTRLAEEVADRAEVKRVFGLYADVLTVNLPVDRPVADAANELRAAVRPRLPLADALIAACARRHNAILVHRDPHLAAIPESIVRQARLPEKR